MTILNELYVSDMKTIQYNTLEINDGATRYFLVGGWDDIAAKLEDGTDVVFKACAMDIALPAKNADGTQDLQFALCNITGEFSNYIREALDDRRRCELIYRVYIEDDLNAPAQAPFRFEVKGGEWTAIQVDVRAGYFNILETAWPRELYDLNKFPMLRYIG